MWRVTEFSDLCAHLEQVRDKMQTVDPAVARVCQEMCQLLNQLYRESNEETLARIEKCFKSLIDRCEDCPDQDTVCSTICIAHHAMRAVRAYVAEDDHACRAGINAALGLKP